MKCRPSIARIARVRQLPGLEALEPRHLLSATYYVSTRGSDANSGLDASHPWQHIQFAFDFATPGSTVYVEAGRYKEKINANVSGNATQGFITFQAVGNVHVDGRGVTGRSIIAINNCSYLRIEGFHLVNELDANDGSAFRLTSADDHIELIDNTISHLTGTSSKAITVYGSDPVNGISNLVIQGNDLYDCKAAPSQAIVLAGNVYNFVVSDNIVHNVTGIGIDVVGGQWISSTAASDTPRNGEVSDNRVSDVHGFSGTPLVAGIEIDGADNIVVERNICWNNPIGIQVACVNGTRTALNDTVRDNIVYNNGKFGLSIGATDATQGRVIDCTVENNTIDHNSLASDGAEIRVQWGSQNTFENNIIDGDGSDILIKAEGGALQNVFDYNLLYDPNGKNRARFDATGISAVGLHAWQQTGQDIHSVFASPKFGGGGEKKFPLEAASPAINKGNPAFTPAAGETDINGHPRVKGVCVDIGAVEAG